MDSKKDQCQQCGFDLSTLENIQETKEVKFCPHCGKEVPLQDTKSGKGHLTGLAGMPDLDLFNTPEEIQAFRERLEKAIKPEFKRLDRAKRRSWEAAAKIILD